MKKPHDQKLEETPSLRLKDLTPEEAKALCDFFQLLYEIDQRCKAEDALKTSAVK